MTSLRRWMLSKNRSWLCEGKCLQEVAWQEMQRKVPFYCLLTKHVSTRNCCSKSNISHSQHGAPGIVAFRQVATTDGRTGDQLSRKPPCENPHNSIYFTRITYKGDGLQGLAYSSTLSGETGWLTKQQLGQTADKLIALWYLLQGCIVEFVEGFLHFSGQQDHQDSSFSLKL